MSASLPLEKVLSLAPPPRLLQNFSHDLEAPQSTSYVFNN